MNNNGWKYNDNEIVLVETIGMDRKQEGKYLAVKK